MESSYAAYGKFISPDSEKIYFCSCSCDLIMTQKNNYISAAGVTLISLHEPGHVLKARCEDLQTHNIHTCTHSRTMYTHAQYAGILCAYWKLQVITSAIMMQPWQF